MDCRNISEATKMATDLYREAIHVPFMAKFVVFAKRTDPFEARLRVFCMTDDKEDKTLEYQEHFTEVAKSRDVEVFEGKPQYTEFAGNLVPVTKSGEQLQIHFKAFRENRLPFNVRVKDQHADTVGRALFMREQRVAKGEQPQQPICILNIVLPEQIYTESVDDNRDLKYRNDRSNLNNIRIVDISNLLGQDWIRLAHELGFTEQEINEIIADNPTSTPRKAQSMLQNYISREDSNRTVLETSLRSIKRDDIIKKCLRLSLYLEKPKPSASGTRKGSSFEEVDNMKDSESVEELAVHEREELKYSAEEKIVENSDGESQEDEIVERSVAERREQITKRLSIERPIPASTQQKEIVQEVAEIKRRSLIEDKKALHEEEIIMHAPTDNIIIKSATIPEPVIKLKSGIKDDVDVTKSDFDRELHDKFKITIKDSESFEHKVTSDLAETISCVDEKIQIDTVTTEKFHKIDTLFDNIEINAEVTPSDKVEPIKELLDHKQIEDLLEPVIATKILESSISTKNFLDNEVKAQSEHVVTQQDPKKAEVIPNTITTTLAIETARDHSQPIESSKDAGTVNYTVQKKAETFLQGNNDADEFYKTIEEKITKKMSQDFSIYKNDDIRDGKHYKKCNLWAMMLLASCLYQLLL
ncbi:ankyrin-2-like [Contarinia nasturtii]|uniref:ankyrin-2-like n=1 Tax=Contarinia nasturtii TaxID=265458 RepID=UPI0012D41878|nr:ankyrin-2-like [Contarinia nasturtii]